MLYRGLTATFTLLASLLAGPSYAQSNRLASFVAMSPPESE
jgi:hypothetical protein